jgi:Arc/MetJ-type ribon-helix-helix transcriptional regulator
MKRVQLQLPDPVVAWIDAQADGIESRASFIRRSIVGLMKAEQKAEQQAEQQRHQLSGATSASSLDRSISPEDAGVI